MAKEKQNKEKQRLILVVITAALTALGTNLASNWLPNLISRLYERITEQPVLVVEVEKDRRPVSGVAIAVTGAASEELLSSSHTNESGIARLRGIRKGTFVVEAVLREGPYERKYVETIKIETVPHTLSLDTERDFPAYILVATRTQPLKIDTPVSNTSALTQFEWNYGKSRLSQDRRVYGILEIDWVEGTKQPKLTVTTQEGELAIETILREVGIELKVVWDTELPLSVMGEDQKFQESELLDIMESYRDDSFGENGWHFYLILGGNPEHSEIQSMMFDTERRRGAVVFSSKERFDERELMFQIVHEIGHMLNLPHPWQTYGASKSVMSFSWRWRDDWSWDDPSIYRFDIVGRQHIARSPEEYVRPGLSPFLEYGAPAPWEKTRK